MPKAEHQGNIQVLINYYICQTVIFQWLEVTPHCFPFFFCIITLQKRTTPLKHKNLLLKLPQSEGFFLFSINENKTGHQKKPHLTRSIYSICSYLPYLFPLSSRNCMGIAFSVTSLFPNHKHPKLAWSHKAYHTLHPNTFVQITILYLVHSLYLVLVYTKTSTCACIKISDSMMPAEKWEKLPVLLKPRSFPLHLGTIFFGWSYLNCTLPSYSK